MKRGAAIIILLTAILLAGCDQRGVQVESEECTQVLEESGEAEAKDSYWYSRGEPIEGQCFDLSMRPIGKVSFASHWPGDAVRESGDAVFLVEKNGVVWQQLEGITENNIRENMTLVRVAAVSFADSNRDGYDDILLICCYKTERADEEYEVRYYQGSETGSFALERNLSASMTEELKKPTIAEARSYLRKEYGFSDEDDREQYVVVGSATDADIQLQVLADNTKVWQGQDANTTYSYAVTDLDQNGRLEVLVAYQQGTGLYTYSRCYEVNAQRTGLNQVDFGLSEGESGPDIIQRTATVYYDGASFSYQYLFEDFMRISADESVSTQVIVSKEGASLIVVPIASMEISASEDGETCTYVSAEGTGLTADEYEDFADQRYEDLQKKTASFDWIVMEAGQFESYTPDQTYRRLESSWKGFDIY